MTLHDKVYNFPTEEKIGFTTEEMEVLLKDFPEITKERFNEALGTNTVALINGKIRVYHCDIVTALRCCLENRDIKPFEFD